MLAVSTWLGHLSYKVRMSSIQLVICWKCAIVIRVLLLQWYLFIVSQYLDIFFSNIIKCMSKSKPDNKRREVSAPRQGQVLLRGPR